MTKIAVKSAPTNRGNRKRHPERGKNGGQKAKNRPKKDNRRSPKQQNITARRAAVVHKYAVTPSTAVYLYNTRPVMVTICKQTFRAPIATTSHRPSVKNTTFFFALPLLFTTFARDRDISGTRMSIAAIGLTTLTIASSTTRTRYQCQNSKIINNLS